MGDMRLEILIIIALAILNGLFSMSELAIVAARKSRLQQRAAHGSRGAQVALNLANEPDRFLSTVQIGITLVGIFAGVFGGATLTKSLEQWVARIPALAAYSQPLSLALVVIGIGYVSLVIGELAPKRVALLNPERIASFVSRPMAALSKVATPIVWLLTTSSTLLLRLFGVRASGDQAVTEDDVKAMMAEGTEAGVFEETEHAIVDRVFRLSDRRVNSLMSPRVDIVWIDIDAPIGDSMRAMIAGGHTYYPVCRSGLETVIGMASVKEQWARMVSKQAPDLRAGMQSILYVPETMPALTLVETFKRGGRHIALVVDEYGGISGLVTLSDVLEAIVGDVPSSSDPRDQAAVQRADGSWLLDGALPIVEARQILDVPPFPNEEDAEYQTLAGMLMAHLGRIPKVSDAVDHAGVRFEVVDMDGRRVDKILAQRVDSSKDGNDGNSSEG